MTTTEAIQYLRRQRGGVRSREELPEGSLTNATFGQLCEYLGFSAAEGFAKRVLEWKMKPEELDAMPLVFTYRQYLEALMKLGGSKL